MGNEFYARMFPLNGKKVLISGGTGGLGSAIAKEFLQSGGAEPADAG